MLKNYPRIFFFPLTLGQDLGWYSVELASEYFFLSRSKIPVQEPVANPLCNGILDLVITDYLGHFCKRCLQEWD